MARISSRAIVSAVIQYDAMSVEQKLALVDMVYKEQPALLGSVVVQHQLGVSMDKIDFLLKILNISFLAMRATGVQWPEITEDDQDRQFKQFMDQFQPHMASEDNPSQEAIGAYVHNHPEKELMAYVMGSLTEWLLNVAPVESDKYIMLSAYNLVDCIAHAGLPPSARPVTIPSAKRRRSGQKLFQDKYQRSTIPRVKD